jgi:nicotinamidase-related amidase
VLAERATTEAAWRILEFDLNVDTLIVRGTTTSGCVRGTVVDAFN